MIAATVAELAARSRPAAPWAVRITRYLSPRHRNDLSGGCPVAALAPESVRQSAPTRAAMTHYVQHLIGQLAAAAPGEGEALETSDAEAPLHLG